VTVCNVPDNDIAHAVMLPTPRKCFTRVGFSY